MSLLTNRVAPPTPQEYMAHGMSLVDAEAMHAADMAFDGAIDTMLAEGWKVKPELPRSEKQEGDWYTAGFRPVVLKQGRLTLSILGPWGRPPTLAAEEALRTPRS